MQDFVHQQYFRYLGSFGTELHHIDCDPAREFVFECTWAYSTPEAHEEL